MAPFINRYVIIRFKTFKYGEFFNLNLLYQKLWREKMKIYERNITKTK
jgi:hypothetical protein